MDRQYNITSIVDIEWACSLPIEEQHPPFWLSGHPVDDLGGDHEQDFNDMYSDVLKVFEEENNGRSLLGTNFHAKVMMGAFEKKSHWY